MNGSEDVIEGFICPICMKDLVSINLLQSHFESEHGEDKLVLQSLKGLYNKVRKLINEDEENYRSIDQKCQNPFENNTEDNDPWNWDPPVTVKKRNHTSLFHQIRSAKIDSYVVETNKLLIRLDKLVSQMPADPVKRKAHERSLVEWADDQHVPLCPFCAQKFYIGRRRHHCRLCGAIMCDDCSCFLELDEARTLTSLLHKGGQVPLITSITTDKSISEQIGAFISNIPRITRSGSHNSLNSIIASIDVMTKDQGLRICEHCFDRLRSRQRQDVKLKTKCLLSMQYHKLREYRTILDKMIPQFTEIARELNEGSSLYSLTEAETLRNKILFTSESMSSCSSKIRSFGLAAIAREGQDVDALKGDHNEGAALAGPCQDQLQRRIHSSTTAFLKEEVLGLPKLPTKERLDQLLEIRRQETEERILQEQKKEKEIEDRNISTLSKIRRKGESPFRSKTTFPDSPMAVTPSKEIVLDTGFVYNPSQHTVTETDDPIVQQMTIIKNYIKEARDCKRMDEVHTLEENLRQLKVEYKRQRNH